MASLLPWESLSAPPFKRGEADRDDCGIHSHAPRFPKPPIASAPLWLRHSNMVLCVTEVREGRRELDDTRPQPPPQHFLWMSQVKVGRVWWSRGGGRTPQGNPRGGLRTSPVCLPCRRVFQPLESHSMCGRRLCHWVVRSNVCPTRHSNGSERCLPTNWMLRGSPSLFWPQGKDMVGAPLKS